jgi:hypothetical protein
VRLAHSYFRILRPLLFRLLLEGLRSAPPILPAVQTRRRYLVTGLICLLTVRASASFWEMSRETLRKGTPAQRPALAVLDWSEMMGLAQWIRDNTPKDAIVSADLDPVFYLCAQRKAIRPFRTDFYAWLASTDVSNETIGSVEDLRSHILRNKIGYIVLTPAYGYIERTYLHELVDKLARSKPAAFQIVKKQNNPEYRVYAVDNAQL